MPEVAIEASATFAVSVSGRPICNGRRTSNRRASIASRMKLAALAFSFSLALFPAHAASNKVRISNLSDVSFGTLPSLSNDAVSSQSVCLFADSLANRYTVTAIGNGPSGAFALSSGLASIPFEVEWSSTPGQASGAQLSPNVPLSGQISSATQQSCNTGPATSASLIVVLRSAALSSATAGTYSGTLTLLVAAE